MATAELGPGVSRFVDDRDRQFALVVFQAGKPPLDSEKNLIGLIDLESRAESIRSRYPSGWIINNENPKRDYVTNPMYSNLFFFGQNNSGETRAAQWSIVNGWLIPVTATRTGAPPLSPNNTDTWNRIELNPPSTSTGGNRAEFVFLEVWLQRIDPDPAVGTAPGKPQPGFLFRFGNVESGFSHVTDDLIDPAMGFETTKRVQIQYRIRVVPDINLSQYPEGFDPTLVFAQGALSVPSVIPFTNMRGTLGDPGLWRAGTGDPTTFGTVDGFVYAVPICAVFRRNSSGFSDVGNLAGAYNRNGIALTRDNSTIYTSILTLPADLNETTTSLSGLTLTGTVFETINSFNEAFFKLDEEIIRVTSITLATGSITFDRGQLETLANAHRAGTKFNIYTVRPDGLFADQIVNTDILDLRHSVADKFDYEQILDTNLKALLKGQLQSTWKRYGSSNSSGPMILYGDRITNSSSFVGGLTRLDAPNGNRRSFSDSATVERYIVSCFAPQTTSIGETLNTTVAPYLITALWSINGNSPAARTISINASAPVPAWFNGDAFDIQIASFQQGLPVSDIDQVRFITPSEDPDAVVIHFEGMTTDPVGGDTDSVVAPLTAPSATTFDFPGSIISGNKILKHGQGVTVSIVGGNLRITLNSGVAATPFQEFLDAFPLATVPDAAYAKKVLMHIEFSVIYGPGRGLSHRPDHVHTVQYLGSPTNASKALLRPGLTDKNRQIPTYLGDSPHVQTGKNRHFARTSEVMIDPGSKTVYSAPYRRMDLDPVLCRDGTKLNWNGSVYLGPCPPYDATPIGCPIIVTPDPLNLFTNRYVEIGFDYVPRLGLHHIPIVAVSNLIFSRGINFFLSSKEGLVTDTGDYNRNLVSYPATSGYYILTPDATLGEVFNGIAGPVSVFGEKATIPQLRASNGGPFRGIRFPPCYGPARITGVYKRATPAVTPTLSPFDSNRVFVNPPGADVNLIRDDFDGPVLLLDVNKDGDVTFVLNADCLDLTKVSPAANFDTDQFIVECTIFGFDRGFLQTNCRIAIVTNTGAGSVEIPANTFTTSTTVGTVFPAPLTFDSVNNEVTVYYSHEPYQGDVFGTQNAYSDDLYRLGPLSISDAQSLFNFPLGPVSTLSLNNKTGYEILASQSFVTSLGTGRLSGSGPTEILDQLFNPDLVKDFPGTLIDLDRKFSLNRVGFEDWPTQNFPLTAASVATRPPILTGALSEEFDKDIASEFTGCVTRLPLGSWFRDKDFLGKTLYQTRHTRGVASVPLGELSFIPFEAFGEQAPLGNSTWEGTEFLASVSNTSGMGGEALIRVDATNTSKTSTTVFKATRGSAGYSASPPWPGGVIASRFPKARPNTDAGSVLVGTAYLVRSQPESLGGIELHPGHELQMIVVTQGVPGYFRDTNIQHSANGTGEGFTALDRFRLRGKPLEKRRTQVSTTLIPSDKPLFVQSTKTGSGDQSQIFQKQETLAVTVNGQTAFVLTEFPLDPTAVEMFVNGIKQQFGIAYTVGGIGLTNKDVTYIPNPPSVPNLIIGDICEFWYLVL